MSDQPTKNQATVKTPASRQLRQLRQRRRRKWELCAAGLFVAIHLTSPLWIGELYPFTISPMFCDNPRECCQYEVFAPDGTRLDAKQFNLHMVYDGNPPGLGMGIVPTPTLHEFGVVASEEEVTDHVRKMLKTWTRDRPDHVIVHQHHFFSADHQISREENVWTVSSVSAEGIGE